jgi:hypothetical protein
MVLYSKDNIMVNQRQSVARKKPSLGSLKRKANNLDTLMSVLFTNFDSELFKNSVYTSILEGYLDLRCSDLVTKGESQKQFERIQSHFKDATAAQLIKYSDIDFETASIEVQLDTINTQEMIALREGAEAAFEPTRIKNFKKITFKEYKALVERKHKVIDRFTTDYTYLLSMKITHFQVIESVMEQYFTGERTLGDLKNWGLRWANILDKNGDASSLQEYVDLPNIKEQNLQIRRDLQIRVHAFLSRLYGDIEKDA